MCSLGISETFGIHDHLTIPSTVAFKIAREMWIKIASTMVGMPDNVLLTLTIRISDSNHRNLSVSKIVHIRGHEFLIEYI